MPARSNAERNIDARSAVKAPSSAFSLMRALENAVSIWAVISSKNRRDSSTGRMGLTPVTRMHFGASVSASAKGKVNACRGVTSGRMSARPMSSGT